MERAIIPFVEGHAVLRWSPNLISATFSIVPDHQCQSEVPSTVLPKLERLRVCSYGYRSLVYGQFLRPFILQSLKHLEIRSTPGPKWLDVHLLSLVTQSSCALERFTAVSLEPLTISAFLAETPTLVELSLFFLRRTDGFSELLTQIAYSTLLPNLRSLRCTADVAEHLLDIFMAPPIIRALPWSLDIAEKDFYLTPRTEDLLSKIRAQGMDFTLSPYPFCPRNRWPLVSDRWYL